MPLRKRTTNKDAPSGSQQVDEGTQGTEDLSDGCNDKDELSASLLSSVPAREKCRRERVKEKKAKDMSEQEMMDLALHLSEQEASDSALQRQQEDEAMMKAIQESMVSQTKPCPSSQSQSLLAEADTSLRSCSQRKHLHKSMVSNADQGDLDVCTSERNQSQVATEARGEKNNRIRKRKMREDTLLLELPDLPQTKRICSQSSTYGSGSLPVIFDTGQSCDSTQIDDCQLHKSPVFPLTGSKAEVHVPRLSQDLLHTCRTSGFVLCSQDDSKTTNNSPPTQPRSPTFPKSQRNPPLSQSTIACPKSPIFSETDQGDDTETQLSPEYMKSPVFGRTTQQDSSSRACKSQVSVCSPTRDNSGSIYSQESFTSSVGPASCRPKSPVFPRTPSLPNNHAPSECSEIPLCSVFLDENERHDKQNPSPVPDKILRPQKIEHDRIPILCRRSSISFEEIKEHSQHLRQDDKIKTNTSVHSDDAEELNEISRDLSEREPTSDMTLHWSDDDEDMTVMGSPSPVFPKESPVHQADSQGPSLTHVAADTRETNEPNRSLNDQSCVSSQSLITSAPASTHRQQFSTTEQASEMGSSQATSQAGPSASRPTVHYYWGVPFCPRGLDADTYTQVILAQMEVYEKSLKQAQRCLLRKAEWGEGISPQPEKSPSPESPAESSQQLIPRRRRLRLRGKKLSEEADSPPVESEEDEESKGKEEEEKRKENKLGKNESGGSIHLDPDDDDVCPETQLSDDSTQDLTMYIEDEPQSTKQPDVEMILQDNNSVVDDSQDETEMEVDATAGKGLEGQEPVSSHGEGQSMTTEEQQDKEEGREDLDVEEIKEREPQRSTSPELDPVAVPPSPESNVECPICQGYFPAAKIEMHAAYCDGEVTVLNKKTPETSCLQVSSKLRRTRAKRAGEEVNNTSNNLEIQEKCCTCQRSFPLRVYSRHKELCTQQHTSKTPLKINEASAMEQNEDTDSEVSLTRRMMMKRRRWGMTGLGDSKSETYPSDHSLQSQKSPVAVVTSKGNSEPRRQANYKDEDCWRSIRMKGKKLSGEPDSQLAEFGEEEEEEQVGKKILEEEEIVEERNKSGPRRQLKSPQQPDVEVTLKEKNPAGDVPLEVEMEVNATVDRHIREQPVATEEDEGTGDPDVQEIKERELPRPTSCDLDPVAVAPSSETNVNCPICQGSFPVAKIEMHAAYCDGEVAVVNQRKTEASDLQVSSKSRRARTRRAADEVNSTSNNSEPQEKCYVCQKFVPLRVYSRHTELCTQKYTSKTASRGNLLSALKQTESMDSEAGPSWSKATAGDIIELQDDDEEEEMVGDGASQFKLSNSPIRSFTPISEATDCLIDFRRQQRAKKPSQRRK